MATARALRNPPAAVRPPAPVIPLLGGGGGAAGALAARRGHLAQLGMWVALVPVGMLFFSFASAYVVRRGLGSSWTPVVLPSLVWANTAVLLASSATLELGRRALRRGGSGAAWVWTTFALGAAFLVGQMVAWSQLTRAGVTVAATAYGSFFYVLTGAHAVHLAGGVLALLAAAVWPADGWMLTRGSAVKVTAIYWHFMDILWAGILFLLVFGR